MTDTLLTLLGVALCAIVLVQLGFWTAGSVLSFFKRQKQFELSQQLLREQIQAAVAQGEQRTQYSSGDNDVGSWQGYRQFRVARLVKETNACTSVYLTPTDKKPICSYLPGQHLTLKFSLPGEPKLVVRCYSLSQGPGTDEYRITVKINPPPRENPSAPPGQVSSFINRQLLQGDLVEVKSPSGHFHLDIASNTPAILLAGGIGVTPMLSMIDYIVCNQPNREVLMFYGSRNGADHVFRSYLSQVQEQFPNIHIINVYSNARPEDQLGVDYHFPGHVSVELLLRALPHLSYQYYMCGPSSFMDSLHNGLVAAGVPESRIHFEAFGPASIGKNRNLNSDNNPATATENTITFAASGVKANWNTNSENILAVGEANGVEMESGCRAGSCETCEVAIIKGKVKYPDGQQVECLPGNCLPCIAQPDGSLELDV